MRIGQGEHREERSCMARFRGFVEQMYLYARKFLKLDLRMTLILLGPASWARCMCETHNLMRTGYVKRMLVGVNEKGSTNSDFDFVGSIRDLLESGGGCRPMPGLYKGFMLTLASKRARTFCRGSLQSMLPTISSSFQDIIERFNIWSELYIIMMHVNTTGIYDNTVIFKFIWWWKGMLCALGDGRNWTHAVGSKLDQTPLSPLEYYAKGAVTLTYW